MSEPTQANVDLNDIDVSELSFTEKVRQYHALRDARIAARPAPDPRWPHIPVRNLTLRDAHADMYLALTAGVIGDSPAANADRLESVYNLQDQWERINAHLEGQPVPFWPQSFAADFLIEESGNVQAVVQREDFTDLVLKEMGAVPERRRVMDEDGERLEWVQPDHELVQEARQEAEALKERVLNENSHTEQRTPSSARRIEELRQALKKNREPVEQDRPSLGGCADVPSLRTESKGRSI